MGVPIKNYENYIINEDGTVYSLLRNKLLKPSLSKCGYHSVELFNKHGSKRFLIHRLVAKAFIQNPFNLPQVNHKDENKTNNCINNLEWCTAKQNMNHGTAPKRRIESRKWFYQSEKIKTISRKNGKVVCKKVVQLTKNNIFVARFESIKQAATQLGINASAISYCCRGKRYKTVGGYKWKYDRG